MDLGELRARKESMKDEGMGNFTCIGESIRDGETKGAKKAGFAVFKPEHRRTMPIYGRMPVEVRAIAAGRPWRLCCQRMASRWTCRLA